MSEFETHLTAVLDDVAAGIHPRPDFEAVVDPPSVGLVPADPSGGGRRFRRAIAVAAASALVLCGAAAAAFGRDDGERDVVTTADSVSAPTTTDATTTAGSDGGPMGDDGPKGDAGHLDERRTDEPRPRTAADEPVDTTAPVTHSAVLGLRVLDGDVVKQAIEGRAAPGERIVAATEHGDAATEAGERGTWRLTLELTDVPPGTVIPIRVTFERSDRVIELTTERPATAISVTTAPQPEPEAAPEPAPQPEPVAFTATLGSGSPTSNPMKQVLYGTATPGSTILATSAYGYATTTAGSKGGWELVLKMYEVPAPSAVRITVTAGTGGRELEFWVERPAPEPQADQQIAFTARRGDVIFDGDLTKVVLYGTGRPGSSVLASSERGAADVRVNDAGNWEMRLVLRGLPPGGRTVVRVTNSAADAVHELVVERPAEPGPRPVDFTAHAALTDSDRTPPVNEYWGTSTAGALITISSEYGGTQVTSNVEGKWDARVEFPDAPVGVTFVVRITSTKGEAVYELPFTRTAPN